MARIHMVSNVTIVVNDEIDNIVHDINKALSTFGNPNRMLKVIPKRVNDVPVRDDPMWLNAYNVLGVGQ